MGDEIIYEFDSNTKEAYRKKTGIYKNKDVFIKERNNNSWPLCKVNADGTLCARELDQFVYMDVGLWGGEGSTGDTETAWKRHRDFGLVSGNAAILCRYDPPDPKKPSDKNPIWLISDKVKDDKDVDKTKDLLKKLSGSDDLGPVTVVDAVICPGDSWDNPTDGKIQVYLGDIHAPIMDDIARARLPGLPTSPPLPQDRARPRGRVSTEWKELAEWAAQIAFIQNFPPNTVLTIAQIKILLGAIAFFVANEKVDKWDNSETISASAAENWFNLYHGTAAKKGADIFQNAGGDLMKFLDLLMNYQNEHLNLGSPEAKLIQLGDLYDFWIGLKRAFETIPNQMVNKDAAIGFVSFWHSESKDRPYIKKLIDDTVSLKPVFVYGNHDNYRDVQDVWDSKWNENSPSEFKSTGVLAEHGHQDDTWNSDSNALRGWALTQLAFFWPNVRNIVEPLRNASEWFGSLGERLTYIRRAARLCRDPKKQPKLRIYVQGHTHEPFIKLVHIMEYCQKP